MKMVQEELKRLNGVIETMRQDQNANLVRLHERMDEMVKKDPVSRKDCGENRDKCKKGGYPAWVVVLFSVASSLIVFVATH